MRLECRLCAVYVPVRRDSLNRPSVAIEPNSGANGVFSVALQQSSDECGLFSVASCVAFKQ